MSDLQKARIEDDTRSPTFRKKLAFMRRHVDAEKPQSILELGCGSGADTRHLKAAKVVGVDIDPSEVEKARALGLDARIGNAGTFHEGGSYDVVIASEVIEHMREPEKLLVNVRRNLKPGGLFIMTTPNGFGFYELTNRHLNPVAHLIRSNLLRRLLGRKPYVSGDSADHCQWFTMSRLLAMHERHGFRLIEQSNSDFVTGSERDTRVADRLPYWLASGWFFAFRDSR